jgi:hypothetical protein
VTLASPRADGQNHLISVPVAEVHASDHGHDTVDIGVLRMHGATVDVNDLRAQHLLFQVNMWVDDHLCISHFSTRDS